jgi:uncharacterized sulfatase
MAELDWSVGQVLDELKQLGLDRQTIIIFTSDNGPWFGGSTGGLRGMKGMTWEGGIRVPMIARWPGHIAGGRVCSGLAGLIDLLPTILKAAGQPLPADRVLDGRDLLPMLISGGASPHDAMIAMLGHRIGCIRSGPWKLHVIPPGWAKYLDEGQQWIDPRGPDGVTILAPFEQYKPTDYPGVKRGDRAQKMMLFNLQSDPAEQHNVAAEHPEVVLRLKAMFDCYAGQVPVTLDMSRPRQTPVHPLTH